MTPAHKYVMDEKLGEIVWMRRKFKYACKKGWEIAVRLTIPAGTKQRCLFYINGKPSASTRKPARSTSSTSRRRS